MSCKRRTCYIEIYQIIGIYWLKIDKDICHVLYYENESNKYLK